MALMIVIVKDNPEKKAKVDAMQGKLAELNELVMEVLE